MLRHYPFPGIWSSITAPTVCISNGRPSHCSITSSFNFNLYFLSASNFPWIATCAPWMLMETACDTNCEGPPSFLLCGAVGLWWWRAHHHHHLQTSTFPSTWNTYRCWCPRCRLTPSNNQSVGVVFNDKKVFDIGFQSRGGELGRGDDREGCQLVTVADGSCLGVMGHSASVVDGVAGRQLLWGEGGL